MIDNKKIEKELLRQVESLSWNSMGERHFYKVGFEDAVEWAQKEFVSSLWHDASEEPKELICVITEAPWEDRLIHMLDWNCGDWEKDAKRQGYIRWCYLDDILPKEGGEK